MSGDEFESMIFSIYAIFFTLSNFKSWDKKRLEFHLIVWWRCTFETKLSHKGNSVDVARNPAIPDIQLLCWWCCYLKSVSPNGKFIWSKPHLIDFTRAWEIDLLIYAGKLWITFPCLALLNPSSMMILSVIPNLCALDKYLWIHSRIHPLVLRSRTSEVWNLWKNNKQKKGSSHH